MHGISDMQYVAQWFTSITAQQMHDKYLASDEKKRT